eukprot:gene43805-55088_t
MLQLKMLDETVVGEFAFRCGFFKEPLVEVLPSGQHELVVEFRPSDQANYIVVQKK